MNTRQPGLIVRCHDLVCAISVHWVSRLVLPDQVHPLAAGLAQIGGERFAAWDLGERLGLARLREAWVLLRVPHDDVEIPLALRTGTCLIVQPLPEPVPVPQDLFTAKKGAISAVFVGQAAHGGALYGLELDIQKLWNAQELDASVELVRGEKGR